MPIFRDLHLKETEPDTRRRPGFQEALREGPKALVEMFESFSENLEEILPRYLGSSITARLQDQVRVDVGQLVSRWFGPIDVQVDVQQFFNITSRVVDGSLVTREGVEVEKWLGLDELPRWRTVSTPVAGRQGFRRTTHYTLRPDEGCRIDVRFPEDVIRAVERAYREMGDDHA